ncbi:MAG: hypothetical protein M1829_002180 [Trizodia sp. TS-e1964]|nr:MAG: hypothetical protein M1829_002180 [Trizodia sp. TS-e1964]
MAYHDGKDMLSLKRPFYMPDEVENPAPKRQKQAYHHHHYLHYKQTLHSGPDEHISSIETAEPLLVRAIAIACKEAGFDAVSPAALEGFRGEVEGCKFSLGAKAYDKWLIDLRVRCIAVLVMRQHIHAFLAPDIANSSRLSLRAIAAQALNVFPSPISPLDNSSFSSSPASSFAASSPTPNAKSHTCTWSRVEWCCRSEAETIHSRSLTRVSKQAYI